MKRRAEHGYTLIELIVALTLSGIVAVLVGSLFIGSLSAWRRGRDLRETQLQAVGLVDLMARDIRNAIRATGVTSRPHLVTDDGDPILLLSAKASGAADGSTAWILYLFFPDRGEVLRQVVVERVISPRITRLIWSRSNSAVNLRLPSLARPCVSIDYPPSGHHTTLHTVSRPIGEQSSCARGSPPGL